MKRYFTVLILLILAFSANAQELLKGTVFAKESNKILGNVFIRNITTKETVLTDMYGHFAIQAAIGHTIIFNLAGYVNDTLLVADMSYKRIILKFGAINLQEVRIFSTGRTFDPRVEFREVYSGTKSKFFLLSPTSWFSSDRKNAKRARKYFVDEEQERRVDQIYTKAYVGRLVPLKGEALENFMAMYRPSYGFLQMNMGGGMVIYLSDCYKKYMALPPEKRMLPKLTAP